MSVRPIWGVPAAWQVADFMSNFDRPSFGTLRARSKRPVRQSPPDRASATHGPSRCAALRRTRRERNVPASLGIPGTHRASATHGPSRCAALRRTRRERNVPASLGIPGTQHRGPRRAVDRQGARVSHVLDRQRASGGGSNSRRQRLLRYRHEPIAGDRSGCDPSGSLHERGAGVRRRRARRLGDHDRRIYPSMVLT